MKLLTTMVLGAAMLVGLAGCPSKNRGESIKLAKCGTTPVDHDYELGQEIGLRGTPAILLANGDMLPGYVPPATLAKRLQSVGR